MQRHFWRKCSFQGYATKLENYRNSRRWGWDMTKTKVPSMWGRGGGVWIFFGTTRYTFLKQTNFCWPKFWCLKTYMWWGTYRICNESKIWRQVYCTASEKKVVETTSAVYIANVSSLHTSENMALKKIVSPQVILQYSQAVKLLRKCFLHVFCWEKLCRIIMVKTTRY